mmetsp:Transcript_51889/g.155722  ORF Transcript_51889/g.155722 Transcript_51889/m.155722 type:complete len:254 (-) Transcript_51889:2564-3325(-)
MPHDGVRAPPSEDFDLFTAHPCQEESHCPSGSHGLCGDVPRYDTVPISDRPSLQAKRLHYFLRPDQAPLPAFRDGAERRVRARIAAPQMFDPPPYHCDWVPDGMQGQSVSRLLPPHGVPLMTEEERREVREIDDCIEDVAVTAVMTISAEEGGVPTAKGGGESVLSALATLPRAEQEEEQHEAKVGNCPLDISFAVVGLEDPQKECDGYGHNPCRWRVFPCVGSELSVSAEVNISQVIHAGVFGPHASEDLDH